MTTKFISLATAIATLDVYLQSQLSSSDPLFLLISSNVVVNLLMVGLAALTVHISFKKRFDSWYGYAACATLATVLLSIALCGLLLSDFTYALWMVFSPLNYFLMGEFGILLAINALSYRHAPVPSSLRLLGLPRLALPFHFALPLPKISQSPNLNRSSSAGAR
jgi:hypothetical protein